MQGMNRDQVLALFDKDKALSALYQMRQAAALRSHQPSRLMCPVLLLW